MEIVPYGAPEIQDRAHRALDRALPGWRTGRLGNITYRFGESSDGEGLDCWIHAPTQELSTRVRAAFEDEFIDLRLTFCG
jgi:hypothetical protein